MNYKEYNEIKEHIKMEEEEVEHVKTIDAFIRVKEGRSVSVNDIEQVNNFYQGIPDLGKNERAYSLHDGLLLLDHQGKMIRDNISASKRRLKRRGLDLDKIRRQRRLEQERKRKEKISELERR